MLEYSHNNWLILASLAVALMAGFTGLSLTRGVSSLNSRHRKVIVTMASVVLGGGIWSMHFVAMLGLQLPIVYYYDALTTLISALVAILMSGLALLVLHFIPRTRTTITLAGITIGLGIVVMHFIGMSGMRLARAEFGVVDVLVSTLAALTLSVPAIWVAYGDRTHRNILLGTACFGFAVFAVHFVAMAQTDFFAIRGVQSIGPELSNEILAMGVTLSVFLICGAFLLTSVTFIAQNNPATTGPHTRSGQADDIPTPGAVADLAAGVPYEKDGQTHFAPHQKVAAIRAEGHYTLLYVADEKLFCPWTITDAQSRLAPTGFLRAHRSYLINPRHVSRFERTKDTGTCFFDEVSSLSKVPVSRSRIGSVREALGL